MNKNNHKYMSFSNKIPASKVFQLYTQFYDEETDKNENQETSFFGIGIQTFGAMSEYQYGPFDHIEFYDYYDYLNSYTVDDEYDYDDDNDADYDAIDEEQYYQSHYHDDRDDAYDSAEYDREQYEDYYNSSLLDF